MDYLVEINENRRIKLINYINENSNKLFKYNNIEEKTNILLKLINVIYKMKNYEYFDSQYQYIVVKMFDKPTEFSQTEISTITYQCLGNYLHINTLIDFDDETNEEIWNEGDSYENWFDDLKIIIDYIDNYYYDMLEYDNNICKYLDDVYKSLSIPNSPFLYE